jgi:NodT family efflux transporter outer membrane factor (OMF) lipoprotein
MRAMSLFKTHLTALAAAALLAGCASSVAPRADTPREGPVADAWPLAATTLTGQRDAASLGWEALVQDTRLREVIRLALVHNRDLRVALLNIEQARETLGVQQAAQRPTLNATGAMSAARSPAEANSSRVDTVSHSYSAGVGITAYELDLWGRVRSLKDSALASYLNTEQAQRSTQLSLVADVATAWLTLAADQQQLALARRTLKSQQDTYALTERRRALGAVSGLTLVQTQGAVETARANVASLSSQVQRDRHALALLVGQAVPDALWPDAELADRPAAALVSVPAGVPSSVLQQRPDVRAAEQLLRASDADVEAARAALYPRISLTASAGTASRTLSDLFQGGAWSFVPSISLPLLDGGASQAAVRKAQISRDLRWAAYDKTVQTAFREVADALSVRESLGERLAAQQALVAASRQALTLAEARYRAGADAWLTVLDAQRTLDTAQQTLITLQLTELSNRVTLYKVLGGGSAAPERGA